MVLGYKLEHYISEDLTNVSLSVLEGPVAYEPEASSVTPAKTLILNSGEGINIVPGTFHVVHTISKEPAYFMYVFTNKTIANNEFNNTDYKESYEKLPISKEFFKRLEKFVKFFYLTFGTIFEYFYQMPLSFIKIIKRI